MNDDELRVVRDNANEFIMQNENVCEIINALQSYLMHLTQETYQEVIQFIQNNKDICFKDHQSSILFFFFILQYARFNYKNLELILDVGIHFKEEMKKTNTTEYELIGICELIPNSIYYLYSQNFFSIETIIKESYSNSYLFIYFLPEIEQYDNEYAKKRERNLFSKKIDSEIDLYEFVKSHPEKHILYRNINYHPSNLHKSIREDDISTFQSILALNNFSVNHRIEFSYYERVMIHDESISLIQAAAIYGSEKIFKFLWMNDEIKLDNNLIKYAFCGLNLNIIHICETKCSIEGAYTEPIATQNFNILDYYIDNFGDQIEEDNFDVKTKLQDFYEENDENIYSVLNYDGLLMAVYTFNYPIFKQCLQKIIFIIRNSELIENNYLIKDCSFMSSCDYNFELFKFFYNQKKPNVDVIYCNCCHYALIKYLYRRANDSFKFLFDKLKDKIDFIDYFEKSLMTNHEMANYLLDLQIEKNSDQIEIIYNQLFKKIISKIEFYDEDIVVKLIEFANVHFTHFSIQDFVEKLNGILSEKMMLSLFNRISLVLPKPVINDMTDFYNTIKDQNLET